MADLRVVSSNTHQNLRWVKPASFGFARSDMMVSLGLREIGRVMMQLPIAITRQDEGFVPVALMGFAAGANLAVSLEGKWLTDYVPILYQAYPFRMVKNNDSKFVLCVDHSSGLIHDRIVGSRFFDEEKKPSPEIAAIIELLIRFESERLSIARISAMLDQHGLIEPWPLQIQTADGIHQVANLFRINEAAMNKLPSDALFEVRNVGGLPLIYGQLFSIQHVQQLGSIAQRERLVDRAESGARTPALDIRDNEGIISFANL